MKKLSILVLLGTSAIALNFYNGKESRQAAKESVAPVKFTANAVAPKNDKFTGRYLALDSITSNTTPQDVNLKWSFLLDISTDKNDSNALVLKNFEYSPTDFTAKMDGYSHFTFKAPANGKNWDVTAFFDADGTLHMFLYEDYGTYSVHHVVEAKRVGPVPPADGYCLVDPKEGEVHERVGE